MKKGIIYIIIAAAATIACVVMLIFSAAAQISRDRTALLETVADTRVMTASASAIVSDNSMLDTSDLFTDRDMVQNPDLSEAQYLTVSDGEDIHISQEGTYVLTGTASDMTVYIEAGDNDKVQLVLDGLNITNADFPCIYIKEADKAFITVSADSSLNVTGSFTADEDTNTDGVIFSKVDLVMNGTAELTINSSEIGVVCKDDLKITGGTYNVTAGTKAFEAKDSIRICDGTFMLEAGTDGLHSENSDDDTKGYIYISGGTFNIQAGDDAIHALSIVQIDEGTFNISAGEGIEATYVQINSAELSIQARDDGINAGRKSNSYYPTIEINGGTVNIEMGAGDTDGVDSNGDIIINGGTISVSGNSTFDCDGTAQYNGGTIIVNGQQTDSIPNQMMGMGGGGSKGGRR